MIEWRKIQITEEEVVLAQKSTMDAYNIIIKVSKTRKMFGDSK